MIQQHISASAVVVQTGTNDIFFKMPETLKDDFMSLVNGLLDTTVHHFQSLHATYTNSTSSERTTQEIEISHMWEISHIISFFNLPELFKQDDLTPVHSGSVYS